MLRILIFNTLYYPYKIGGAEISVKNLAEQLAKDASIRVGVITIGEKDDHFINNNVEVWRLKIENSYWPFDSQNKTTYQKLLWHIKDVENNKYDDNIINIVKKFKPNIINTNNLTGISVNVWNIAKKLEVKIVHTLRDYYLLCPKLNMFKKNKVCNTGCIECKLLSVNKKKASLKVDGVVGISKYILEKHINSGYFMNSNKAVIYNGFILNSRRNAKTFFDEKSFINFGFIGQINQSKGIELLLNCLKKLVHFDNWKVYIAGNIGEEYQKKLSKQLPLDRVVFLGFLDSRDFYKKINVLVVPSIWEEPFGRVVYEGIINKKVVIGSNRGGIKELLLNNSGYMFTPSEDYLHELLDKILRTPIFLNQFKFDESIIEKFSIKNTVDSYKELYAKILKI